MSDFYKEALLVSSKLNRSKRTRFKPEMLHLGTHEIAQNPKAATKRRSARNKKDARKRRSKRSRDEIKEELPVVHSKSRSTLQDYSSMTRVDHLSCLLVSEVTGLPQWTFVVHGWPDGKRFLQACLCSGFLIFHVSEHFQMLHCQRRSL
jgi:hypothetical protein